MNIDFTVDVVGHAFHFYRRMVGSRHVFTLYVDGTSVWQESKEC